MAGGNHRSLCLGAIERILEKANAWGFQLTERGSVEVWDVTGPTGGLPSSRQTTGHK